MLVALIIRMNSDSAIPEHCFRARCGDRDKCVIGPFKPIFQVPQGAFLLALLYFQIRNSGQQFWIPVHQPLITVDQPVAMHLHERLNDGAGQPVIKREAVAFPIR